MKNIPKFIIPLIGVFIISCTKGECNLDKPLQPSFKQDKFNVRLGESVTFTYDGPTQPKSVNLRWKRRSLNYAVNGDKGDIINGETTATFRFNYLGGHTITLEAENCNDDVPRVEIVNAVVVEE